MGLLRFLLIFALIYLVFRFIVRLGLPWVLNRFVRKAQRNFEHQYGAPPEQSIYEEGDISISQPKSDKSKSRPENDEGDYVDFEDVKD